MNRSLATTLSAAILTTGCGGQASGEQATILEPSTTAETVPTTEVPFMQTSLPESTTEATGTLPVAPTSLAETPNTTLVVEAADTTSASESDGDCFNCLYLQGDSLLQGLIIYADTVSDLEAMGWNVMHRESCGKPVVHDSPTYEACGGEPVSFTALGQIQQPEDAEFISHAAVNLSVLGSNDHYRSPTEINAAFQQYEAEIVRLNPDIRSYWTTTFFDPGAEQDYQRINDGIVQSGATVIDFAAVAPQYYSPDRDYGLHPNQAGYQVLEDLIIANVGSPQG